MALFPIRVMIKVGSDLSMRYMNLGSIGSGVASLMVLLAFVMMAGVFMENNYTILVS
jgi:hypothetical protein